jgi:hypothetical protein
VRDPHDLAGVPRRPRRSGRLGLDADEAHLRSHLLDRDRDPRDHPAAADRHEHGGQVGNLLEQLQADGALPGDHIFVVERRDRGEIFLLRDPSRLHRGLVEDRAREHDPRAVATGVRHLDERRGLGHDDRGGNAQAPAVVGDPLGVVARAGGDDPAGALLRIEAQQPVQRSPVLEGAGPLQVLELQIERVRDDVLEAPSARAGRRDDTVAYALGRLQHRPARRRGHISRWVGGH